MALRGGPFGAAVATSRALGPSREVFGPPTPSQGVLLDPGRPLEGLPGLSHWTLQSGFVIVPDSRVHEGCFLLPSLLYPHRILPLLFSLTDASDMEGAELERHTSCTF